MQNKDIKLCEYNNIIMIQCNLAKHGGQSDQYTGKEIPSSSRMENYDAQSTMKTEN